MVYEVDAPHGNGIPQPGHITLGLGKTQPRIIRLITQAIHTVKTLKYLAVIVVATIIVTFLVTGTFSGERDDVLPVIPRNMTFPDTWSVTDDGHESVTDVHMIHRNCSFHAERSTIMINGKGIYRTTMWCDPDSSRPDDIDGTVPEDFEFGLENVICDVGFMYVSHPDDDIPVDHLHVYHHCMDTGG